MHEFHPHPHSFLLDFLAVLAVLGWCLFLLCLADHNVCHVLRALLPLLGPEQD